MITCEEKRMTPAQLKQQRNELSYTQQQMADHLAITLRGYQFWEAGDRKIPNLVERFLETSGL